ncbi:polysaccharide deacetylase family protein [Paraflavisolibacter sp. H34]|uniref:polysaccharide deacetylase family protein n=1 Tax=Huijunlia imazamoxiresistens TaxID=3127457 RepID=UPI00301A14F2
MNQLTNTSYLVYMYRYFIKTHRLVKRLFPAYVWSMPATEKVVYLTFDDGPHPRATPFVLDELKKHAAEATFFCLGKNVLQHPDLYRRILAEGHATGNHTHDHLNGWKVTTEAYLANVAEAAKHIHSPLFRPPYGKIRRRQARQITELLGPHSRIIMWDVLSADFATSLSGEDCLGYVLKYYGPGSVIVFHDSEKAFPRLEYVLPRVLERLGQEGYRFLKIGS